MSNSFIERARAMKPQLRERAARVEQERIVGQDTIAEFREAEFFKMLQPKEYGGYELPPSMLTDVIYEVASACGSSGWVLAVLALHQWEVKHLPEQAREEIWGEDRDVLLSSAYAPTGQVEPVDGGFLLSGEWPYSSGCDHAQWAIVGGIRPPMAPGDEPALCSFFVPRSEYEIIDDWQVMGMAGTGSKRLKMEKVFVPNHRHHPIFGAAPTPPAHINAIYKVPFVQVFGEMLAGAAHGMARGILDQYIERNQSRMGAFDRSKYADNPDVHRYIAETEYAIRAARAVSHVNQKAALDAAQDGPEQPLIEKARHLWELSKSVHACTEACTRLYSVSGAHTIFEGDSLQRAVRDLECAVTHVSFVFNSYGRNYGAMHMGHPNTLNLI